MCFFSTTYVWGPPLGSWVRDPLEGVKIPRFVFFNFNFIYLFFLDFLGCVSIRKAECFAHKFFVSRCFAQKCFYAERVVRKRVLAWVEKRVNKHRFAEKKRILAPQTERVYMSERICAPKCGCIFPIPSNTFMRIRTCCETPRESGGDD